MCFKKLINFVIYNHTIWVADMTLAYYRITMSITKLNVWVTFIIELFFIENVTILKPVRSSIIYFNFHCIRTQCFVEYEVCTLALD
jgi:hypothetical protein